MGIHMDAFEAKTKKRRNWARKMRLVGILLLLATLVMWVICYSLNIPTDVALTPWTSIPIAFGAFYGIATFLWGVLESY
jgi:hypothetical protein